MVGLRFLCTALRVAARNMHTQFGPFEPMVKEMLCNIKIDQREMEKLLPETCIPSLELFIPTVTK